MFRSPAAGLLRFDDHAVVTQTRWDGVILRHYAFVDRWFKVNVTIDSTGALIETGGGGQLFALNCDIATPMEKSDQSVYAVDLFLDVLIRSDATTYVVTDEDEFTHAVDRGLVSEREADGARRGLQELRELIEAGRLIRFLDDVAPFEAADPPDAPPMERVPIPARLAPRSRSSW